MTPQAIVDFIESREGFRTTAYLDTKNIPTGGLGHRLLPQERAQYPIGASIPASVLDTWAEADTAKAYDAAQAQAALLGVTDENFIKVLTSVNFQLGTDWNEEFASTWHYCLNHEWQAAAKHIGGLPWARETPVRVHDFQSALLALVEPPVNNGTGGHDA